MKSFTSFFNIFLVIMILTGCAAGEKSGQAGASADSGGSAWSMSQDIYNAENDGYWRNIQYRNGQLYYSTVVHTEEDVGGISVVNTFSEGEEPTQKFALHEGDYLENYAVDAAGAIYVLGRGIDVKKEKSYFLLKLDENGEEIYRVPLSDFAKTVRAEGLADMDVDKGGICAVTNEGTCLMWSLDGQKTGQVAMEWYEEGMNFGTGDFGLVIGKDGMYVYHLKGPKVFLQFVSPEQGTVYAELELSLPALAVGAGQQADVRLYSGYEEGIYVTRTDNLFLYDDGTKENTKILNWEDAGVNAQRDQVEAIGKDSMGNLLLAAYDFGRKEGIIACIAERTDEENGREILEIGYLYESDRWESKDYVSRFNAIQDKYELRYHQYANLTDLQLALVQGKGPDIISLASLTVENLTAKGVLENLSPYFDESEALSGKELLPSIRQGMTLNGEIRFIFPCFSLKAMVLAEGDAQGSSITTKDFLKLAGKEGDSYLYGEKFGSIDGRALLRILLQTDMGQYVDWQSGTCSFDDGRFAELLEEIKQVKLPENRFLNTERLTLAEQMHQGLYHAMFCQVGNMYDYVQLKEGYQGIANVTGYPNQAGTEQYLINPSLLQLGINSASEHKQEAWEFLEYVLLEYGPGLPDESNYMASFSVFTDVFENQLYPQAVPNWGYKLLNQYTEEVTEGFFQVTEQDRETVRRMVDCAVWNQGASQSIVSSIIYSEAEWFFNGDKTAAEVADIIQNQVQLYLSE